MLNKENIQNLYVLTPLQEGILFHQLHEGGTAYFEQARFRFHGPLDPPRFRQAWESLAARHEIFRTIFVHEKVPRPLQLVLRQSPLSFHFEDLSPLSRPVSAARLDTFCQEDLARPFALHRAPPLRLALFRLHPEEHEFVWSFHHILLDGWSLAILQRDFEAIYLALEEGRAVNLPPAPQFRSYVKWLEGHDQQRSLAFWQEELAGYQQLASLSTFSALETSYAVAELELTLEEELSVALRREAQQRGATLGSLFRALWGVTLALFDQKEDVVFAATVSGRPADLPQGGEIAGLFINAVPVRVALPEEQSLGRLVEELQRAGARSQPHHYSSLAEIQALTPLGSGLLDSLLVFENYPEADASRLPFRQVGFSVSEHTTYATEVQVFPEPAVRIRLRYNRLACAGRLAAQLQQGIPLIAAAFAHEPELSIGELRRRLAAQGIGPRRLRLQVAATFIAEELEETCRSRLRVLGCNAELHFSGYNQIFAELADSASPLQGGGDVGILLARFEDALYGHPEHPAAALRTFRELLLNALSAWPGTVPLLVGLFPVDPTLEAGLRTTLTDLYAELARQVATIPGLYPLDLRQLEKSYQVRQSFDPKTEQEGHIPYSSEFMAALGSEVARASLALLGHPFKVLAVDGDNTLWGGICGEIGVEQVETGGGYCALQEFLLARHQEGMLLAIISKNEEADVLAILDRHPGMLLRREHFVTHRINWQDKPANLRAIAAELGLGSDSFIFIDDSRAECARMMHECPEVLTLPLPTDPRHFAPFLAHLWATDKLAVTLEDRQRPALYRAEQQRQRAQQNFGRDEYRRALHLEMVLRPAQPAQAERIAQLSQRTNQFNLNLNRRTPRQVCDFLTVAGNSGLTLEVSDSFGSYGLAGVVLLRQQGTKAEIETLLLSCRVLGRGVEEGVLAGLARWCREAGVTNLFASYLPGPRNRQVADLLRRSGFAETAGQDGRSDFSLPVADLPPLQEDLTLHFAEAIAEESPVPLPPPPGAEPSRAPKELRAETTSDWELPPLLPGLQHDGYYLPLTIHTANRMISTRRWQRPAAPRPYAAPQTKTEVSVTAIFSELLRRQLLGSDDNFFTCGGHSLLAIRVLARLYRELGVQVDIATLFAHPTARSLAAWLDGRGGSSDYQPIPLSAAAPHYPLSPAQRRLWVLDRLEPGNVAYNIFAVDRMVGPLDLVALRSALSALVERHEILRTVYLSVDGEPRQQVLPESALRVECEEAESEEAAQERCRALAALPFDLTAEIPLRLRLLRRGEQEHLLVFTLHHIAGDGWSLGVLLQEFLSLYRAARLGAPSPLPPPRLQYRDYATWQSARLEGGELAEARRYWLSQFAEGVAPLPLATDFPRPRRPDWQGATWSGQLEKELSRGLSDLALAHGASLFMVLQSVLRVLLYRYTMQEEIVLGTVSAGRTHPDLDKQVGFYVNTLALRETTRPQESFLTLLERVKKTTLDAFAHQSYPFDRLVDELPLSRDTARAPLFDLLLVLQNHEAPDFVVDGLTITPVAIPETSSRFDLTFLFTPQGDELALQINYATALYREETIAALAGHLQQLAHALVAAPRAPLGQAEMLAPAERQRLLQASRGAVRPLPAGITVVDLLRTEAQRHPQRLALLAGEQSWSYGEVDALTDRMAQALAHDYAVTPGSRVGLYCSRGPWTVLAAVAVLKAAAVYVPIDARYPQERIALLLGDAAPAVVLRCEVAADELLPPGYPVIDAAALAAAGAGRAPLPRAPRPDEAAYVIYTSGSTGRPKGVQIPHRGLVNLVLEQGRAFAMAADDRVLQFASPGFDASVSEIFVTLCCGAGLVCVTEVDLAERGSLLNLMKRWQVSVVTFPPAYLAHFTAAELSGLKTLVTAGESPRLHQVREFAARLRYINAYGPTENTVCATLYCVDASAPLPDPLPIGRPIANVACYLLDRQQRLVPDGVVGEIALAGVALADGYLGREELTSGAFVTSPDLPGERLYRSGDQGKRRPDGELLFLGRRDDQVKVRGYRIELEEIRLALAAHPRLRDVAIVPVGVDGVYTSLLAAYVAEEPAPAVSELRAYLSERLPNFMVPERWVAVPQLPLNRHGKIDTAAVLALDRPERHLHQPLRTAAECVVAAAFATALHCQEIGRSGHFFELGGNSLSALRVASLLQQEFPAATVSTLFEYPQVSQLAAYLEAAESSAGYALHHGFGDGDLFIFPSIDNSFSGVSSKIAKALSPGRAVTLDFVPERFADHCEEVARRLMRRPQQTIFLGYSGGGNFAFEVARRLGPKAPRALLLVDSWIFEQPPRAEDYLPWHQHLCATTGISGDSKAFKDYIAMVPSCSSPEAIASDIVVLSSTDQEPENGSMHRRWSDKTRGSCRILPGAGSHFDMFSTTHFRPNIQAAKEVIDGLIKVSAVS